jgi:hypothetical protein
VSTDDFTLTGDDARRVLQRATLYLVYQVGMTQSQIAAHVGTHRNVIGSYLSGDAGASHDYGFLVVAMARHYGFRDLPEAEALFVTKNGDPQDEVLYAIRRMCSAVAAWLAGDRDRAVALFSESIRVAKGAIEEVLGR